MQISSHRSSSVVRDHNNLFASSPLQKRAQHASIGHHDNHKQPWLLSLPQESLNHITKYLDVPAFLALTRTCSALHAHVNEDNTWHSAFNCQFLGDDVGYDARPRNAGLLRRVERSWMKEFVYRSNLLNRWERSKTATVGHTPHYSSIHTMQLLADSTYPSLLTASLQYGVVARSLPLTGKIIKGYIAASETGLGIGNPNAEFAPNITACAISTSANTANTVWGHGNGEVAISHTTKVMDHLKTSSKLIRCRVEDEHIGRVVDIHWADNGTHFLTAGVDGTVKLWRADDLKCLWKLERQAGTPDGPCEKVVADFGCGVVAASLANGIVLLWTNINMLSAETDGQFTKVASNAIQVSLPSILNPPEGHSRSSCTILLSGPTRASDKSYFGIHFEGEDEWYRISLSTIAPHACEVVRFKGGPLGPIRSLYPYFSEDEGTSIVFAGDELGRVSLFDWNAQIFDSAGSIPSFRRFDAHDDGAITAIACTSCVIVTGSSKGSTNIWDILTFAPLRTIPSPVLRSNTGVGGIIVDRDLLIVSVEARIVTWKGAPVKEKKSRTLKNPARNKQFVTAKWTKKLELAKEVSESRECLDFEHERTQRSHSRERAQLSSLQSLGLDEVEAVEYVLMLSRDEEEERRRAQQRHIPADSIFADDFDEEMLPTEGGLEFDDGFRRRPTPIPSPAITSLQISPPVRPEPMEAGFSTSPLMISDSSRREGGLDPGVIPPSLGDSSHFPSMSSTPSGSSVSSASRTRSISESPEVKPSSWSALLKDKAPMKATTVAAAGLASTRPLTTSKSVSIPKPGVSGPSLLSASLRKHSIGSVTSDEDEDLRLALELSLAESLSMQ
ncbi:hypothetical protein SCHPADRAFT_819510 [Schizopora paradoxa]|uniref:F-box domain-containing protein n=1 Tax=Schizopora paradoxa TaxID=27342 RepID=A0A0H2SNR2_9AGAM|nr:hypothetical protein SCHPADRAFT_819510 [Schizopora paradoxa]